MSLIHKPLLTLSACLLTSTLLGCQQLPQASTTAAAAQIVAQLPAMPALPKVAAVPTPAQLLALTPAQLADFDQYAALPENATLPKSQLLFQYMQQYNTNFSFQGKTLLASEALAAKSGNCVSLALITHALAQYLNLQTAYRLTYGQPVLDLADDMLVEAYHVRSYLLERNTDPGADHNTGFRLYYIDYYRQPLDTLGPVINENDFFAMVYNNLAAEAWLAGQQQLAMAYNQQALQLAPTHGPSINLMAVMLRRLGDWALAKQWYEFGMQQPDRKPMLLQNYLQLARAEQDLPKINELTAALAVLPVTTDPMQYLLLASEAEQQGELHKASRLYKLLLAQQPAMLQPVQGLLRIYLARHDSKGAEELLKHLIWQHKNSDKAELYQTKLAGLRQISKADPSP